MRLAVGIPSNGEIKSETVACVIQALFQTRMSGLGLVFPTGCLIHENRNAIAEEALEQDFDYLMCIDADMTFPPDAITTLLSRDKHIIGANYHKRGKIPKEHTTLGWPTSSLCLEPFQCKGMGMGFVLIKVGVFKLLDKPWFYHTFTSGTNDFEGEDYTFFTNVQKKGITIWCDPTISIGHLGDYKY
jgi:hypothetical protein